MTNTVHLGMPFIEGSQAQKHVTHNEALRILDAAVQIGVLDVTLTSPPPTPAEGERHVVASGATGAWAGQADTIATYEDGAWRFLTPKLGWCLWSDADATLFVYDGAGWRDVLSMGTMSDSADLLGINTTASSPNLLAIRSNAMLLKAIEVADGGTGDARLQISKGSSTKVASVVFSDAFSGRAEFGLVGSDAFKLKVSNDGTTFVEALNIDQSSGNVTFPRGFALTGVVSPSQITANQNDYNPTGIAAASVLQLSSDASRSISGIAGGAEGRVLTVLNVGSQPINLLDENAASLAANRLTLGSDLALAAKQAAILRYDGTALRWYALARPGAGRLLAANNLSDLVSSATARVNLGVRDVLTANRSYYVRTDGSNSNNGLANTSGSAFLTIQKAIDTVATLDIATFSVTINVADGTYTGANTVNGAWLGSGVVSVVGNTTTPANVIINPASGSCFRAQNGGSLTVSGMEVRGGVGLQASYGGMITAGSAMRFGTASAYQIYSAGGGKIFLNSSYAIVGGALNHIQCGQGSVVTGTNLTVTLTGTPAFTTAFISANGAGAEVDYFLNTFSGSATGSRYQAVNGGFISVAGASITYLPGNAAGTGTNFSASPWGLIV